MSFFSKLYGTVATFFQVGGPNGPGWFDDSGNLDGYSSSHTYINVRGADPVIANDFVTLEYANTNFGSAATETTLGTVYLGAYCYNSIPAATVVTVAAGATLLQAGNLTITGDLVLTLGDYCAVD